MDDKNQSLISGTSNASFLLLISVSLLPQLRLTVCPPLSLSLMPGPLLLISISLSPLQSLRSLANYNIGGLCSSCPNVTLWESGCYTSFSASCAYSHHTLYLIPSERVGHPLRNLRFYGASGKGRYGRTRTRTRTRAKINFQPFSSLCSVGQKLNMVIHWLKLLA